MPYNLDNIALPEEEGRDLKTHVKLCAIRHSQVLDEIRKTNENLITFFKERDERLDTKLENYISASNARHTRNERVAVVAFFVVSASLWPQLTHLFAPIASAITGFVVPAARAIGMF